MYAGDYDALPPAGRWSDCLLEHVHSGSFVCPEAPRLRSGYAFNRALAGMSAAEFLKLPRLDRTVLLYESDVGWNGAGGPEDLVRQPRHRGKDVCAFADGSGRAVERDKESDLIWQPGE